MILKSLRRRSVFIFLLSTCILNKVWADTDEGQKEEEGSSSVGPGKAITQAIKKQGFQLSPNAIQTLGIKSQTIQSQGTHRVPKQAVVRFQDEAGVYRVRQGWFKLVEINPLPQTTSDFLVKTEEIQPGDQIVIEGVPLLRVAELEAWGGSGDGHGH